MKLSELMAALATQLGLDDLPPSDDGFYRLTLDDDLDLRIAHSEETGEIVVLCHFLDLPQGDSGAAVMRMLLGANYRWAFSARGHFSMNPQSDAVEYALREKLSELNVDRFTQILQAVGAVLATVKTEVRGGGLADVSAQGTQPAPADALSV